jgi:long-chain acyl-CoA synthetase
LSNRAERLFAQARSRPDKAAIVFEGVNITFAEFSQEVRRVAAGLQAAGFAPGHKLGLMLSNRPEFVFLQHAAFTLGGVVVPLNIHYKSAEIEHALGTCEVDFLATETDLAGVVRSDIRERCPALRRVFVLGLARDVADELKRPGAELWGHEPQLDAPAQRQPTDLALMLHTSATTGHAKGVMLTIGNLQANYDRTPEWLGLDENDVILCALPLYNTFGLNQCINAMVITGCTLVLLRRFDALACLAASERHRCTFLPAVPTMLQKILYHPDAERFDLSSLKRFLVGAAPVPASLLGRMLDQIGRDATVMTGYGLTEGTALVTTHRVGLDASGEMIRPKTIGKPVPSIQLEIQDAVANTLPPHTVGEICIKGTSVMQGYYGMPEETARTIIDGWLHTGDLGYVDDKGFFYIVDRKKDVIIRGGQNVYPADIEDVLYRHPAVVETAVIGEPDELLGEVPKAFVALKPSAHATPEALLAFCKTELAYFKVPVSITILAELPKGPTGKILRRSLKNG